ncbi:DUF551 domain-containing protein [Klebsiella michiganensis]
MPPVQPVADSEPVAYIDKQWTLVYYVPPMCMGLKIGDKLYRHAQPAPVVPDERAAFNAWNNEDNLPIAGVSAKNAAWLAWQARAEMAGNSPVIPDGSTAGMFNSARALLDALYEFGPDEIAISEHVTNLEDALQNAAAPQSLGSEPATVPGKWIPVSEQMPEDEQEVLTINKMGHHFVSFLDKHSGLFFDRLDAPAACCIEHVLVTHWMPLPAAPQELKGE